jgi:hypothetical protein
MIISAQDLLIPFYNRKKIPKNFVISDENYFCPTKSLIQNEIFPQYWKWLSSLRLTKWIHKWDCDNFADAFKLFSCGYYANIIEHDAKSIGIGVINYIANSKAEDGLKGGHAINIIYSENQNSNDGFGNFDLLFLEPQTGQFYDLTEEEFNSIWTVYI